MTDRIGNAMRRLHSTELHNTTIEVFEPNIDYTAGDGWDVTYPGYPDAPDATVDARIDEPSTDEETERSGATSEIDVVVTVRDDTSQQWTGFGDEQDAPAHVQGTADGTRYALREPLDMHNGLLEIGAVEV